MDATRSLLVRQTIVGEPERRDDERREAARSGGSPPIVRETSSAPPDAEVTARRARRRFTTHSKLEMLRKADACTRSGQLGALLRKEGLYSSHLVTWRRQREEGLTPKHRVTSTFEHRLSGPAKAGHYVPYHVQVSFRT